MKRVFTLASSFFEDGGHDKAYHTALQTAFARLGYLVFTLIPINCRANGLDPKWIRFFRKSPRTRFFDYLSLLRQNPDIQILFLESFSYWELCMLLGALFLFRRRAIVLWLVLRDGFEWSPRRQKIYVKTIRLLSWVLRGRLKLFSDSALAIRSLSATLKHPISLLPIPHTEFPIFTISKNPKISLWMPGKPRLEKGLHSILTFCQSKDPALKNMKLCIERNDLLAAADLSIEIEWIPTNLPRREYLCQLERVDALLLPYDPLLYASRTSGPFVEAICAKKSVFVRDGSWLANELRNYDLTEWILDWEDPMAPSMILNVLHSKKLERISRAYHQMHTQASFEKTLHFHANGG